MFRLDLFIKSLKEKKINGATQEAVGKAIGKDQAYISLINQGKRPFLEEYIPLLIESYGEENVIPFWDADYKNLANADNRSTSIAGNGNHHINANTTLEMAINEIAEQRKLVAKSQEQIDRLLSIIENFNK